MREKTARFRRLINKVLKAEKKYKKVGAVRIYFTNGKYMRELNQKFRKIDRTTDVLSFYMGDKKDLGEVVISEAEKSPKRLVVHGVLHLLGYDHKKKNEREKMRKREELYLK